MVFWTFTTFVRGRTVLSHSIRTRYGHDTDATSASLPLRTGYGKITDKVRTRYGFKTDEIRRSNTDLLRILYGRRLRVCRLSFGLPVIGVIRFTRLDWFDKPCQGENRHHCPDGDFRKDLFKVFSDLGESGIILRIVFSHIRTRSKKWKS